MNTNNSPANTQTDAQSPAPTNNTPPQSKAADVFARLNSAADPLKYVANSGQLNTPVQGTVITDPREAPVEKPTEQEPPKEAEPQEASFEFSFDDIPLVIQEEPQVEGDENGEQPDDTQHLAPEEVEEVVGPKKSIKDLRKALNENNSRLQTVQTELETATQELERYRSGEIESEKLREQEERISNLERYEKLHNLKLSKEYKQKYVDPLESLKQQARALAEDYGVNAAIFDQALQIDNKKDLHAFLKQHFDDVGTIEARDTVLSLREHFNRIHEAEREPQQELERLQSEYQQHEQLQLQTRMTEVANNSKSSWSTGLAELRSKGDYPELLIRANDEEHNKIAKPILQEAAKEFGHTVKMLVQNGAKDLSPAFLKMLAKRFLLSQASSVISKSRDYHNQRAEEVLTTNKRQSSMRRPPIGSTMNGNHAAPTRQKPKTLEEAAQRHMDEVLSRTQQKA